VGDQDLLSLVLIQWVPLLGGAVVPLMALVNHNVYRATFGSFGAGRNFDLGGRAGWAV
jgi:hypothetical protein